MPNDDFESFLNKVDGYEEALKQEYEVASTADEEDQLNTVRKLIEKKIAVALPGFVDDLILIARAGDTDSSRLKAIRSHSTGISRNLPAQMIHSAAY